MAESEGQTSRKPRGSMRRRLNMFHGLLASSFSYLYALRVSDRLRGVDLLTTRCGGELGKHLIFPSNGAEEDDVKQ